MGMHVNLGGGRRHAFGAGRWFPADAEALRGCIADDLRRVPVRPLPGRLLGGIAPHAGIGYSGPVAAHTFRALQASLASDGVPDLVVVLGAVHRGGFTGCALMDGEVFVTPLGASALASEASGLLVASGAGIHLDAGPHGGEHSAENLIPFIQHILPTTPLVIGLFGGHDDATERAMGEGLHRLALVRRILVFASTDLLHDPDYDRVTRSDAGTLRAIAALDVAALRQAWRPDWQVCCGISPVLALLHYLRRCGGVQGEVLAYRNCGDDYPETRGHWVVGYGSVIFAEAPGREGDGGSGENN